MITHATTTDCPPQGELERLMHGRCTEARSAALCEHVGACPDCQKRLDALSRAGDDLVGQLREAVKDTPPSDSAYWKRLADAEEELGRTALFPPSSGEVGASNRGDRSDLGDLGRGDLRLDFLQPPD
ncbi:MAG: hypothetical protein K2V38_23540, partial [Gemmataceae bacterium]|nr:hypothetical protein [Gemmataceae bacterium]